MLRQCLKSKVPVFGSDLHQKHAQPRDCAFMRGSMKFSILLLLLSCAGQALSQVNSLFYVSVAGSDSNPGSEAAPWRTVQHAADTARAGSTVNVRGGIYEELVSIN